MTDKQEGDFWCWAANAFNISRFYDSNTRWSQCSIACDCFDPPRQCCVNKDSCDEQNRLTLALEVTGNLERQVDEIIGINEIVDNIDRGLVIGVRVYADDMGHFVTIHGYDISRSEPYVYVSDPLNDITFTPLQNLVNNYNQYNTEWTHTYYTKSNDNPVMFTKRNRNLLSHSLEIKPSRKVIKNREFLTENYKSQRLAHEAYVISLKSLRNNHPDIYKIGIRLIGKSENNSDLIFEYDDDKNLRQVLDSKESNTVYINLLMSIINNYEDNDSLQLRVVRQPQLRLEAFWLHNLQDTDKDLFFPVRSSQIFNFGKAIDSKTFFSALKKRASKMILLDDKEFGG